MSGRRVPLGEIADFVNGVAFKPSDWGESGKRIIRIQNLTDPSKPYNWTNRAVDQKYHVAPGDLLVSWSATLGVFRWQGPDTALVNQHIFRVVPDVEQTDPGYLRHMLSDALIEMERHLHGATMKHVNRKEFLSTTIPLPPLAEQKRIAGILDTADALRAKRRESIEQLDTLLQSVFLDMFGDPVVNPRGWELVPITDAVDGKYGIKAGPFGSALKKEDYSSSGFRVYGQEQVIAGRFDIGDYYVDELKFEKLKNCAVATGDVLVSLVGSYGKVLIVPEGVEPGIINPRLLKITPRQELVTSVYLATLFQNEATQRRLERLSHGGTMGILNAGLVKQLTIPTPPLGLQHRFAAIVESVDTQSARLQNHLAELDTLFASLQSRAFRGNL